MRRDDWIDLAKPVAGVGAIVVALSVGLYAVDAPWFIWAYLYAAVALGVGIGWVWEP